MKIIALLTLLVMPALAQQPKFEMADVHVSATARGSVQSFGGVLRDGRFFDRDVTMLGAIEEAYGVGEDALAGGPGWMASDLFDLIGKVPDGTTQANAKLMLQSLLADRFKLVVRNETRPVPRYVLSGGASKLKPASGSGEPGCKPQEEAPPPGGGRGPVDPASIPNIKVTCRSVTSADIATNLRQMAGGYLDHDVIDSTNLEGTYDFDIEWTGRGLLAAKGADGISIFDAVSKQLGLKLELKDVPLPALAIVSVERKPTGNAPGVAVALAEAPPRFEAASIKPADPDHPMMGLRYTGGSQMTGGGTLRAMIAMSLSIPPNVATDRIIGLPKSADAQAWVVTAKVPATGAGAPNTAANGRLVPPPFSVAQQMLFAELQTQFGLKFHTENREVTVYAITRGPGKPKMTKADDSERYGCKPDANVPKPMPSVTMMSCKNMTMADLAQEVVQMANAYVDHPVVDATGLEGGWDFAIGWTPRGLLDAPPASNPSAAAGAAATPDLATGISFFDAIEKELGLKLVKQTRSIPVTVVDHVEEKPIE